MAQNKLLKLCVRLFSSKKKEFIRPPLAVFGTNGKYASALYSAATKQKSLEIVERDLAKVQNAIVSDQKLQETMINRSLRSEEKVELMKKLATDLSLSITTSMFLQLLAENGRLGNLNGVIKTFTLIMVAHRSQVMVEVTTAIEMDATQKQKLEEVLKTFLKPNQTLNLTLKIDPQILGGMLVFIGDKFIDMSVATKIEKYKELLHTPIFD